MYGRPGVVADQRKPTCSGRCPAGHACPEKTVRPAPCTPGEYCPVGSTKASTTATHGAQIPRAVAVHSTHTPMNDACCVWLICARCHRMVIFSKTLPADHTLEWTSGWNSHDEL